MQNPSHGKALKSSGFSHFIKLFEKMAFFD